MVIEEDLRRPLVPLKVSKCSIELHLGTIPGRVGWVGSNSDYNAISVQLQLQLPTGTELGNRNFDLKKIFWSEKTFWSKKSLRQSFLDQ